MRSPCLERSGFVRRNRGGFAAGFRVGRLRRQDLGFRIQDLGGTGVAEASSAETDWDGSAQRLLRMKQILLYCRAR